MITASQQCRESSTATGYSPLRTPLTKSIPVIMKSGNSCVSRRKNLFWRLSGRGSINRSQSGTPGWIKRLIMFSTGEIQQRPIWKTGVAALPIISARMRSVHSQWGGRTGCSAVLLTVRMPVRWSTQWLRWQKHTDLIFTDILNFCWSIGRIKI